MLKDKLLQRGASKVILFGSKARGDFKEKSDIDIAYESDKDIFTDDLIGNFDIINLHKADEKLKQKIGKEGIEI